MERAEGLRKDKLWYYFKQFSKEEIERYRHFISSAYHNESRLQEKIFEKYLILVDRTESPCDSASFYQALYPEGDWNEKSANYLRTLMAKQLNLLLEFVTIEHFKNDQASRDLHLVAAHLQKKWDKYLPAVIKKSKAALEGKQGLRAGFYRLMFDAAWHQYLSDNPAIRQGTNIRQLLPQLETQFLSQILKLACAAANEALDTGNQVEAPLLPYILNYIAAENISQTGVLGGYLHALVLLQRDSQAAAVRDQHFDGLRDLLTRHEEFGTEEFMALITYAFNHLVRDLNIGQDTDKNMQRMRALLDNLLANPQFSTQVIPARWVKNIIAIRCKQAKSTSDLDAVMAFLETYRERISNDVEGRYYQYNLAVVHFYQGNFSTVKEILYARAHFSEFRDILYGIGGRVYYFKALFELEVEEKAGFSTLMSPLNSFRVFLSRKEIPEGQAQAYRKFCRYATKLVRAYQQVGNRRTDRLSQLFAAIEENGDASFSPWINAQIAAQ